MTHEIYCHVIYSLNRVIILESNIATILQIKNKLLVSITEEKTTVTTDMLQSTRQQLTCRLSVFSATNEVWVMS
jgi:hypothetical protein